MRGCSLKEGSLFLMGNLGRVVSIEHVHDIIREVAHILANHETEMSKVVFLVELECLKLSLCPPVIFDSGKHI